MPQGREVGVSLCLRTDYGLQLTYRDFQDFLTPWGVHHVVSSPHYPKSSSHAEVAVKSVKHLILKTTSTARTFTLTSWNCRISQSFQAVPLHISYTVPHYAPMYVLIRIPRCSGTKKSIASSPPPTWSHVDLQRSLKSARDETTIVREEGGVDQ